MRNIWDGFLSLLCAVATIVICGVPGWYAHVAISNGLAPQWVYVSVFGLGFCAVLLTLSFLRKASAGVAPSRERRR